MVSGGLLGGGGGGGGGKIKLRITYVLQFVCINGLHTTSLKSQSVLNFNTRVRYEMKWAGGHVSDRFTST